MMTDFGKRFGRFFSMTAIAAVLMLSTVPNAVAQDDVIPAPLTPLADPLAPPPLPKLDKAGWASKKAEFNDALAAEDPDGNDLDKLFDLPGTTWSAHIDVPKNAPATEAEDEDDPISRAMEPFMEALSQKHYDYRVALDSGHYFLQAAADDGEAGDVSGMSVIAQDKLRFIAVTERTNGDIEIFISDTVPVADLMQEITGKEKKTPAPK